MNLLLTVPDPTFALIRFESCVSNREREEKWREISNIALPKESEEGVRRLELGCETCDLLFVETSSSSRLACDFVRTH